MYYKFKANILYSCKYPDDVITPAYLLIGRSIQGHISVNKNINQTVDRNQADYSKKVVNLKTLLDNYWKRFIKNYLDQLGEHQLNNQPKCCNNDKLSVNNMVLIRDNNHTLRSRWKRGMVDEAIVSKDEKVQDAILRVMPLCGTINLSK